MVMAEPARQAKGRYATSLLQRLLAALVALLLSASALGQAAHFLLVPHTICAEHGELLEVDERASHVDREREQTASDAPEPRASQPEISAEHDHCQVLARGQREQAPVRASLSVLLPAPLAPEAPASFARPAPSAQELTLSLAPKTSPPRAPNA
jgi:hypothetical protein